MFTRKLSALVLAVSLVLLSSCAYPLPSQPRANLPPALAPTAAPALARALGQLPLYFVANRGQTDPRVAFYLPGRDQTLYFTPDGVTFAFASASAITPTASAPLPTASARAMALLDRPTQALAPSPAQRWALKLGFVGANPNVRPIGQSQTQAVFSYFKGPASQWQSGLPSYAQIRYPNLWPGIDLVYSGQANHLKYEFEVQPGADPAQIQLAYRGASSVQLTADGQLAVTTPLGGFRDAAPLAYQVKDGQRLPVSMSYALNPSTSAGAAGYSFHLGAYDTSLPLVLDPAILVYAGYIGGPGDEYGWGIAVDSAGNAYVTGYTTSDETTFPVTVGPDLTFNGYSDAFVVKVNAAGTALLYAGYIGGSSGESGRGIAVDSAGNAYITGQTNSDQTTFPVTGGPGLAYNGNGDVFVAKVNAAGTALLYAGYIGGAGNDYSSGIAVDDAGNAYVTGRTNSDQTNFPVTVGPDLTYNGGYDAFVAKVNAAGTALVYAGYIGGANDDFGTSIAIDRAGNAYVTGYTQSDQTTFPVTVGPDLTFNGGDAINCCDAFVAKVDLAGTALDYSGYVGGVREDYGRGIAVDDAGNAYITGETFSNQITFPVTIGPDLTYNGSEDAFVAKVNAAGTALVYAGFIGGANIDAGYGIAVDSAGNAYVTGYTFSNQTVNAFPVTGGPDLTYNYGGDAFVARVNTAGTALDYAGYIGGSSYDSGYGIAVDSAGNAYVTGRTTSNQKTFPVTGGLDQTYNGGNSYGDAFVAKVSLAYSVSGFVTDPNNLPLAGVVVSAGVGGSATTDAAGVYTITGVLSGTYTLIPNLSGYVFDPPTRLVAVPPDATGLDFVYTPTFISTDTPTATTTQTQRPTPTRPTRTPTSTRTTTPTRTLRPTATPPTRTPSPTRTPTPTPQVIGT